MDVKINKQAFEEGFCKGALDSGSPTGSIGSQIGAWIGKAVEPIRNAWNTYQDPHVQEFLQKTPEERQRLFGIYDKAKPMIDWFGQHPTLGRAAQFAMNHPIAIGSSLLGGGMLLGSQLFGNKQVPAAPSSTPSQQSPPQHQAIRVNTPEPQVSEQWPKIAATSPWPTIADKVVSSVVDPEELPDAKLQVSIRAKGEKAKKMLKDPVIRAYIRNMVNTSDRQAEAVKGNV